MDTNNIIKMVVVVTLCLALLGIVGLVYVGKVEPNMVVGFVLSAFSGLLGGGAAVGLTQYGSKQGVTTALNILRSEK